MGNIISSKISGICGGSIDDGVDDYASAKEVDQKLHTPKLHQKDEQQLVSPSPTTVGTSDVVSDTTPSDMEDDETSSFIGDISFDSLPLAYDEPQEKSKMNQTHNMEPDEQLSSPTTVVTSGVSDDISLDIEEKVVNVSFDGVGEIDSTSEDKSQEATQNVVSPAEQQLSQSPTTVVTSSVSDGTSLDIEKKVRSVSIDSAEVDSFPSDEPQAKKTQDVSPVQQLSSVATVLLHHHLSNISDENKKLRNDNSKIEEVRSMLTEICIHAGDIDEDDGTQDVIEEIDLAKGLIIDMKHSKTSVEDENGNISHHVFAVPFYKIPPEEVVVGGKLSFSLKDAESIPFSSLWDMKVTRSGQTIGEFHGLSKETFIDETVNPTILLGRSISLQGSISGLSDANIDLFRSLNDGDEDVATRAAETIMEYLRTGVGVEDVTFKPFGFFMEITPQVKKVLDILAPLCRIESEVDSGSSHVSKAEHEVLVYNIVEAIGCDDENQKKMLEDNKTLQATNTALIALLDIVKTLEIGTLSFSLSDGQLAVIMGESDDIDEDTRIFWILDWSEKNVTVAAKDLCHPLLLSGVGINPEPPFEGFDDQEDESITNLLLNYDNGTVLYASFNKNNPIGDFSESDTPIKLKKIVFNVEVIVDKLKLLGTFDGKDE